MLYELLEEWMGNAGYKYVVEHETKFVQNEYGKRARIEITNPGVFVRKVKKSGKSKKENDPVALRRSER